MVVGNDEVNNYNIETIKCLLAKLNAILVYKEEIGHSKKYMLL
jgi:hypothetical protein